jgi:hypothetical protein
MESSTPARILIVAYRTAATPTLVEEVRGRAARGPCAFTLLVPDLHGVDEESASTEAQLILELAVPLLEDAAGSRVDGVVGHWDPFEAVRELLEERDIDEILVSTLPARVSRWLSRDLPGRLGELGPRVSVITGPESSRPLTDLPEAPATP